MTETTETKAGIEYGVTTAEERDEVRHIKALSGAAALDRKELLARLKQHRTRWLRELAEKGGIDDDNRSVLAIASTVGVDRQREIVLPRAMKEALPPFLGGSSPLLTQHTHRTASGSPGQIGWVMNGLVDQGLTLTEMRFDAPDHADDAANGWWSRASNRKGKGIMFSIGFIPLRYARGQISDLLREFPEIREAVKVAELADDDRILLWIEIELLEVSSVAVGANRGAMEVIDSKALLGGVAVKEIAAEVVLRLVDEFDVPGKIATAVKAAVAGDPGAPGGVLLEAKTDPKMDQVLDKLSELVELLCLSPEYDGGGATRTGADAPPPGDGADAPGGGEGAKALKAAAKRIKAAMA